MNSKPEEKEDSPPVPKWLAKLEEQREKRLKAKLGHEAGAGAPCQVCGDKCPGLDLHFWRKICKVCKCGKEDHDIADEDLYGFVQFTLLGSKPVKSKGILLKGHKDEVILEFTPKGASNDVKKYLDELPADLIPVRGSEAAKLRKQRLQKQMPAHDIDPTLCHALTDKEIKEFEEYVAHIRNHSVGQGKIIRIPLFKSVQHNLPASNSKILSQNVSHRVASSQAVYLQPGDVTNNLQSLSLKEKQLQNVPSNLMPEKPLKLVEGTQNPIKVDQNIHDLKYNTLNAQNNMLAHKNQHLTAVYPKTGMHPSSFDQSPVDPSFSVKNIVHPLTTSNVERHQELINANLDRVYNPNLNYAPNFIAPIEQHQLPTQIGQCKDLKYPPGSQHVLNNAATDKIYNPMPQYAPNFINPMEEYHNPTRPGQLKDYQAQSHLFDPNNAEIPPPINQSTHPMAQINPKLSRKGQLPNLAAQNLLNPMENLQNPSFNPEYLKDLNNPVDNMPPNPAFGNLPAGRSLSPNSLKQNQSRLSNLQPQYPPNSAETFANAGYTRDVLHPANFDQFNSNVPLSNPLHAHGLSKKGQPGSVPGQIAVDPRIQEDKYPPNPSETLANAGYTRDTLLPGNFDQFNSNVPLSNPLHAHGMSKKGQPPLIPGQTAMDPRVQEENLVNVSPYPYDANSNHPAKVLQAQNLINPLEEQRTMASVGYLHDINYQAAETNSNLPPPVCHECKEIFADGSIAVTAERTSNLWHAQCFVCHTCKQPLADLMYFYHKGSDNIYCGRDYASLKNIPRCVACDELIFVKEYCLAEDATFHVKHFCCFECDQPLAGKSYVMENNQPVCVECFENLKAENCQDCLKVIRPEQQGVSLQGLHWHACDECFACKKCRKPLLGNKMLLRSETLFCSDFCYKNF